MFKKTIKMLAAALLLMTAGGIAWAVVNSEGFNATGAVGAPIIIPLKLTTSNTVGGINGEFVYDPAVFGSPSITEGIGGNAGFIALGNMATPGHYKFVVYSDPTKPMDIKYPVAFFQLSVLPTVSKSQVAQLTYQTVAASDTGANSLNAAFSAVNVKLLSAGVNDWSLYE